MPTPRKEQVSKHINGHYHCISRAVRRAFLCGVDKQSGCNYEHRRQWILDRLEVLAGQFAVEVCAYTIMSNHYHLVLHVDYEQSLTWDADEVVKRWCTLFPPQALKDSDDKQIDTEVVNAYFARLTADEEKVTLWRERLADLSWFMRCLNEPIARQANKEDECTGRFWEGRFKSQALLDDAALISCMAYVDLNPVRAAIAQTPEDSEFTSFAARVEIQKKSVSKPEPQSQWLLPFAESKKTGKPQATQNAHVCLPISQDEYFELVDWTGRCIRDGKRGAIPAHIQPILQRLEIKQDNWIDGIQHYGNHFYKVVGIMRHLLEETERQGRKWFKGQSAARLLYQ
ncbi:transposase [Candidatus Venteria ishoeyi]|uniref:Transposase IS200-like domain-containing protein n=2 Tax=Candidatus Venteria ishoeyi TaxID=1899563 RepID=A0A1H6FC76_9GAMM|nr:transposase [Candidatus Venteria ishoeyi]SEH07678.1 Uncharacterised protein [Candidatus Venteria ishoeyi]